MSAYFESIADYVPPEILEEIFLNLDPVSRKAVRLVNRKWSSVLWTDYHLRNRVLLVNPATLTDDWVLQQMKRPFAEIHVTTDVIPSGNWHTIYYDRVKELLTSSVITENLRSISIEANAKVLHYLFYHPGRTVSYQKLEEFTFLTRADSLWEGKVKISADCPKLRVLKLDSVNSGSIRLVRHFAQQLTKLVFRIAYRRQLLAILSLGKLEKLTELSIETISHGRSVLQVLARNDFDLQHLTILRRLERLEINDDANLFAEVYHSILVEMQNLTHLQLTGGEMQPDVLQSINQMPQLQFLQLLARSSNLRYMPMVRFNLPNLETLHLAPQLMACAGDLPKLTTLGVINHLNESVSWSHYPGPEALKTFALLETIQKLHIRGVHFSTDNLHPVMHFPASCKVLLEDKEGFTIGTVNATETVEVASLRCDYLGKMGDLTIRRPVVESSEEDHELTQFVAEYCMIWHEYRLMRCWDRIVHDYKACKRAIQRYNLYELKKYGCECNFDYR